MCNNFLNILSVDITIGIIYPPLRDVMISNSLCMNISTNHQQDINDNINELIYTNSSSNTTTTTNTNNKANNSYTTFHYVYVGRLAKEKSPGLLIRTINYIFQQSLYHIDSSILLNGIYTNTSQIIMTEEELSIFKQHVHITFAGDGILRLELQEYVNSLGMFNHYICIYLYTQIYILS